MIYETWKFPERQTPIYVFRTSDCVYLTNQEPIGCEVQPHESHTEGQDSGLMMYRRQVNGGFGSSPGRYSFRQWAKMRREANAVRIQ